ncbi:MULTISPECIES: class I SAM-dependent methyltransferase [unclassified Schlesneria]|uniref:class I SAM-dependent methyltransferase n=1 Tax=Schlesneria TaxID=656899 RepID=UPI002F11F56F
MSRRNKKVEETIPHSFFIRPQEKLLIDTLPDMSGKRVICTSAGRAQFAVAYATDHPDAQVDCWFLDIFHRTQSEFRISEDGPPPPNLNLICQPDLPDHEADLVAFAFKKGGEAELTRDLLQQGHQRLVEGGRMVVSTDNDEDQWIHKELRAIFPKVTRRPVRKQGTVYLATKVAPLKKLKDFDCEFAFRDRGRLIYAYSRPGVFSHRHIDGGARALMNKMVVKPGMKVLDLGSGAGTVSLAAAFAAENVSVHAVDSNARAIQSLERGIAKNEAPGITYALDAEGETPASDEFDLALANPPYFSNYAIADLFLDTGHRALKPKSKILIVTKTPNWFVERMPLWYGDVEVAEANDYWIVTGRKRKESLADQPRERRSREQYD